VSLLEKEAKCAVEREEKQEGGRFPSSRMSRGDINLCKGREYRNSSGLRASVGVRSHQSHVSAGYRVYGTCMCNANRYSVHYSWIGSTVRSLWAVIWKVLYHMAHKRHIFLKL